ncbi:hypothetical protein SAMN05661080_03582 [Modestobacter sp. DSM 44400]|nr:hypothetical protein SAMN05661080_03582 [Modestobacter sp. DSM 44400]
MVVAGAPDVVPDDGAPVSAGPVVSAPDVVVRDGVVGLWVGPEVVATGASDVVGAGASAGVVTGAMFPAGVPDVVSVDTGGTYSSPAMTNRVPRATVEVRARPIRAGTDRGHRRRRLVAGAVLT